MATSDSPLSVPDVTLAVARASGGNLVTVFGSGFGPAPNVVLLRTMREGSNGATVQAAPPEGEVGTLGLISDQQYVEWNGEAVYRGNDELGNNEGMEFVAPQKFKRFRLHTAIAVPDEGWMPGSIDIGFRSFPEDAGWKAVWIMDGNIGDKQGFADMAAPTHLLSGNFNITGNSCQPNYVPFMGTAVGGKGSRWDWDRFVGFHIAQDSDLANPKTVNAPTPLESGVTFSGGTISQSETGPAFAGGDDGVTDANAEYDRVRYQPLARSADGNAQAYFRDFYLAIESSPDAGDWRQALFLGDAAAFSDCTVLRPKLYSSWSDSQITFTNDYGLPYYHVVKPDGSIISGVAL